MIKRLSPAFALLILSIVLGACGVLNPQPTLTPLYVTATPRVVIVTNTPTLAATSVVAPSVPPAGGGDTGVSSGSTTVAQAPPTTTPTRAITLTPTFTPTPTDTPVTPGAASVFVPSGGVGAGGFGSGICAAPPAGGFGTIYNSDPSVSSRLSCPIDSAVMLAAAYQPFERGLMIWVSQVGTSGQPGIYVFYNNNTYQRFIDTWREGVDANSGGFTPPTGLQEPVRGFGKVWREAGGVRDGLGWATSVEAGTTGVIQVFERGEMLYIAINGQTYIAVAGTPGTWTSVAIPY